MSEPAPRRRVWMLTSVHGPRDSRIFHREAVSAAAAGFDVTIVAPGAPDRAEDGVAFVGLPAWGGRAGRLLRWPVLLWKAARGRADIYHLHDPELLPWGLLLQLVTRRPVVYDSHEFFAESLLSKLWLPAWLRTRLSRMADPIEKWVAARLAAVVVVTPEMAERFRPVQPRTVLVMNLPPAPLEQGTGPERRPVAIYAGLMNRERGLDILRATAGQVRARRQDFELWVLGPVEWQGLAAERAQPASAWEAAGVRFLGAVAQPEVVSHLAKASVGWLPMNPSIPSKRLAWPVKLGEYMAAGLPVVASDLPVQVQVIEAAGCGVVVPEFSAQAHAAAIVELLQDPDRARALGEAGRAHAAQHLTWESQAAVLVDLYHSLLARGHRRPAAEPGTR